MRDTDRDVRLRFAAILAVVPVLAFGGGSGCSDNLYADCRPASDLGCDSESAASCIAKPVFQCDSRICGKYRNSPTFCTKRCSSNGDCNPGVCKRFILGTDDKYCVQKQHVGDGG
ncbi:MAG: hypothetical protein ABEL76_03160 [Bradymonadaceae bacterium]